MRKELKANQTDPDGFERECRVLSLLNCLKHPNIVELLGSYTCNGVHSLIFPVAEHDLDQLLKSPQGGKLKSEADYLFALCGLASALEKLHNFVSEGLQVSLIGCHHDLRPHNILIQDRRFLLADFGLSSLKEVTKGSKTSWKRGDNRYLAPECEDEENEFQPGTIGRKCDIWSFGCILAEVATYMIRGARGVEDFTKRRKVTLAERWTVYTFHAGRHPNEGLQAWLASLGKESSETGAALLHLVNDMLKIEPDDRPTAEHVTQRLRCLAMRSELQDVSRSFGVLTDQRKSHDLLIEKERLTLWGQIIDVAGSSSETYQMKDDLKSGDFFYCHFQSLENIGQETKPEFEPQDDFHARTLRLRMINDDMLHGLPHSSQVRINDFLEQKMVDTDDLGLLQEIQKAFDKTSQYRSIGMLAAVKYMHQLCESPLDGHGRRMQLQSVSWAQSNKSAHFAVGILRANDQPPIQALVESIKYEEHWLEEIGDEMFNRIGPVAELLRATKSDKDMRILTPLGYFHQPQYQSFGLAFYIPLSLRTDKDRLPEVVTLRQYMENHQKIRPSLEERMLLARRLASALARIHKVK